MFPVSRYCVVYAEGLTSLFPASRYCAVYAKGLTPLFHVSRYCAVYAKGLTSLFPVNRYYTLHTIYCICKCTATQVEQFCSYAAYSMKNPCNSIVRFFYRCTEYRSCHGMFPAGAGLLCDTVAVFGVAKKE